MNQQRCGCGSTTEQTTCDFNSGHRFTKDGRQCVRCDTCTCVIDGTSAVIVERCSR